MRSRFGSGETMGRLGPRVLRGRVCRNCQDRNGTRNVGLTGRSRVRAQPYRQSAPLKTRASRLAEAVGYGPYFVIAKFTGRCGRSISLFKKFVVGFSHMRYVPAATTRPIASMAPKYAHA